MPPPHKKWVKKEPGEPAPKQAPKQAAKQAPRQPQQAPPQPERALVPAAAAGQRPPPLTPQRQRVAALGDVPMSPGGGGGGGGGDGDDGGHYEGGDLGRDESLPWKRRRNQGPYTGAPRPKYPTVFRPYGSNTRQRVVGDRSGVTRMHTMGYAKGIVESLPTQSLFPSHCPLGQSGAPAVLSSVPALRSGSSHLLFTVR